MPPPTYEQDPFSKLSIPTDCFVVVPNDSTDLRNPAILYIGSGGSLTVIVRNTTVTTSFTNIPNGSFFPVNVSRVLTTGTTCTSIVALC